MSAFNVPVSVECLKHNFCDRKIFFINVHLIQNKDVISSKFLCNFSYGKKARGGFNSGMISINFTNAARQVLVEYRRIDALSPRENNRRALEKCGFSVWLGKSSQWIHYIRRGKQVRGGKWQKCGGIKNQNKCQQFIETYFEH